MILLWEAETQKKCCVLFTDRGGEYTNSLLKEWCLSKSIVHHYSVPRTPEQNGRAERFNQTITNICRALLFNYKLKDSLMGSCHDLCMYDLQCVYEQKAWYD
jgi:transposase InsO family protein